jgi:hypothetical protein
MAFAWSYADAIVAACEAWPTVSGYVPCHYKEGCGCEMVPARVRAAIAALGQATDPPNPFAIETCPKCGAEGVAFICSEPGCPVNGGADYGSSSPPEKVTAPTPPASDLERVRSNILGLRCWVAADSQTNVSAATQIARAAIAAMGQVTDRDAGQISDGCHTFNELYEHRHALFLALCRSQVDRAWRAQQHHDGSSFEGWFILGIGDQPGHQITYHLPMRLWDDAAFVKTLHRAPEWDGHTSNDVIDRIKIVDYLEQRGPK